MMAKKDKGVITLLSLLLEQLFAVGKEYLAYQRMHPFLLLLLSSSLAQLGSHIESDIYTYVHA